MKKSVLVFYLFILTISVKEPAFAEKKSTFASSICRDQLIANLPDQGQDILSGAIIIAQHLRPSNPQVDLYHIFLAAMTEVHVDGGPITYTNPKLLAFLRRQNLLEDFQDFLLNNLGLKDDQIDSLFEKKSDGTLILNTDKPLDHGFISDFNSYTSAASRLLTAVTEKREASVLSFSNDFFLYILELHNPIRSFFFDRWIESSPFSERTPGRPPSSQMKAAGIKLMYLGYGSLNSSNNYVRESIASKLTNPIIAFDITNKKASLANGYPYHLVMNPSPYVPDVLFLDLEHFVEGSELFVRALEQQTVDDSNRFIRFKTNNTYVYGKIIGFSKDDKLINPDIGEYKTSVIIESLDDQRYTFSFYKAFSFYGREDGSDSALVMGEKSRLGDAFGGMGYVKIEDASLSKTLSKELFDSYQKIRDLVGSPMPLNQHTPNRNINLFRGLFNLIALNNYLRKRYPEQNANQVSLSDFDEDRHFVSFLNAQGERVPGKLIEVNSYNSVTVEDLNGQRTVIEGEALNKVFQDKSVRLLFQYSHSVHVSETGSQPIVQRQGEGFSYAQLEMSGDPAQDAFRKALIAGRFEGDERFISFPFGDERRLGKVVSWEENKIILQVGDADFRSIRHSLLLAPLDFIFLWNSSRASSAAVSQIAKEYFERREYFLDRRSIEVAADEDYQFLSRSIPAIRRDSGTFDEMIIDLTDPSLKRWMRTATDMIKEKTGITPGPQNLTAAQRIQIYRVFHDDIVPLIESPRRDQQVEEYAYFSRLISQRENERLYFEENSGRRNLFRHLGYTLDTKSAVCAQLSAFGVVLFSEYGLHATYMKTSEQIIEMETVGDNRVHGHAWIGVRREDGSLEFIDTNGRIFWSTSLRLLREHYPESLSYLSDDELLSLSEEYTLVIPPSSE